MTVWGVIYLPLLELFFEDLVVSGAGAGAGAAGAGLDAVGKSLPFISQRLKPSVSLSSKPVSK
jgi:hypothetical protein